MHVFCINWAHKSNVRYTAKVGVLKLFICIYCDRQFSFWLEPVFTFHLERNLLYSICFTLDACTSSLLLLANECLLKIEFIYKSAADPYGNIDGLCDTRQCRCRTRNKDLCFWKWILISLISWTLIN